MEPYRRREGEERNPDHEMIDGNKKWEVEAILAHRDVRGPLVQKPKGQMQKRRGVSAKSKGRRQHSRR